jgi:hypothetical protein
MIRWTDLADSSPKQGQILPSIWVFKEHKSQTAFLLLAAHLLKFSLSMFLSAQSRLPATLPSPFPSLPACCLKNSLHKIAGRSCQHSSSSSHSLSTANLKILKVGFIFIISSIPLSPDSTWTSHSVPVSSPTMRQSLLKLSGSWK